MKKQATYLQNILRFPSSRNPRQTPVENTLLMPGSSVPNTSLLAWPQQTMRFPILLACLVLLAASGALSLLLGPVSYEKLQDLGQLLYLEKEFAHLPLALTPDRYTALRGMLFGVAGTSLLVAAGLLRHATYRRELRCLAAEVTGAWAALLRTGRGLTKVEKTMGLGLLTLLLVARTGVLLTYGLRYDELLSYHFFVRAGPVAISSYYPAPNNHILFNFCCAVLQPLFNDSPLLIMRLPSYLAATIGTALSYALLTRFTNFRLATLVTALFNLTPAALYYAVSGRGYCLQFVLMQLGFFAVIGLGCRPYYQRLGWLVLITSSILGLYTIPTYAYPMASLLLGAVLVLRLREDRMQAHWRPLLLASAVIGAASAVLYAPVGAVSGWSLLLTNSYVTPLSWADFRALALGNIYEKTEVLFGLVRPILLVGAALLVLGPIALLRVRLTPVERCMAWVTWAMLVMPIAIIAAQHVHPPTRVIVYMSYFGFLLAAVALWLGAARWRGFRLPTSTQLALVGVCIVGAGAARFGEVMARMNKIRHEETQLTQAWHWLRARQPHQVLLGSFEIYLYHYAVQDHQRVVLSSEPIPGRHYDYLVLQAEELTPPAWTKPLPYRAVFRNDFVSIYAIPHPH